MAETDEIQDVLRGMGLNPQVDDDGDIYFRYQMKYFYLLKSQDGEHYISIVFPQFYEIDDEKCEDALVLAVCNSLTRSLKLVKVFVDETCKNVTASSNFYYSDNASLENLLRKSLCALGVVSSLFIKTKTEFSE